MHNDLMYYSHASQYDILASRISSSGMTDELERELALSEMYRYDVTPTTWLADLKLTIMTVAEGLKNVSRSMHMQNIKTM